MMIVHPKAKEMANAIWKNVSYNLLENKLAEFIHPYLQWKDRAERAEAEIKKLRQTHWDMRAKAGFDNDGDRTPVAVVSDFSKLMEDDWNNIILEQQESNDEIDSLRAELKEERNKL